MKKKGFSSCNNPNHEGKSNIWFTPKRIINSLGEFDMDPCTVSYRYFDTAKKHICFDNNENGLLLKWKGRVWLNPPYGKETNIWLDKLYEHGNGIALVFARCGVRWAQKHMRLCNGVNFLKARISFINKEGLQGTNAADASMLLAYGVNNLESLYNLDGIVFKN